jgi:hypothetical protein
MNKIDDNYVFFIINWSIYGQIVEDAKGVLRSFLNWQVCHTKREGNSEAHGLAKEGVHPVMIRVWVDSVAEGIN